MDQRRRRLTLEDYVFFFGSRSGKGLTIDLLNQIVFMHGFIKFHHSNKPVILDALNSVELLRPRRSTVSINAVAPPPSAAAPSAAALSTEDVKRDIADLGWRECPIGSLLSVSAPSPVPLATVLPGSGAVQRVSPPSTLTSPLPPAAPAVAGKRKWASTGQGKEAVRRKKKSMGELLTRPSLEVEDSSTGA